MPTRPAGPAVALRGGAAGVMTAALAVAAHGWAGSPLPAAAATLVALVSAALGAVAAAAGRVADPRILAGLLTGGQLTAHLLLSAAGHSHAAAPSGPMPAVHLFAVLVGAGLISAAERLCRLLYTRLRAPVVAPPWAVPTGGRSPLRRPEQPLRSRLLLAVSISHRGPPVAVR